jgi:hypothetical protein
MRISSRLATLLTAFSAALLSAPVIGHEQEAPVSPANAPFEVVQSVPLRVQSDKFVRKTGWTGGDAAYSISLGNGHTLWLFGDSFIGTIEGGRRQSMKMIHNSCALQNLSSPKSALKFFWRLQDGKDEALFRPQASDNFYYWPGDGIYMAGKLYVFCKTILSKPGGGPFDFSWIGEDVLEISNPKDEPGKWYYRAQTLPGGEAELFPGTACLNEGEYVYIFCTINSQDKSKRGKRGIALARLRSTSLSAFDFSNLEYLCNNPLQHSASAENWSKNPIDLKILFADAPSEMSVSRVVGLPGFWAVYSPNGLSDRIVVRSAPSLAGPWSQPVEVYHCPEPQSQSGLLCYGAKNHPELTKERATLVVTYCLNPGDMAAHKASPYTYFPRAVKVLIKAAGD